jgi:hypothetical protein
MAALPYRSVAIKPSRIATESLHTSDAAIMKITAIII